MGAVVLFLTWACAIGITTTASRMTWSFARDAGTPFSYYIRKVDRRTKVPIIAVGVVTTFAALLTLIYIGSSTAFNDVISLTITGFYGSYFLPAAFLLWHRLKGDINPHGSPADIEADSPDAHHHQEADPDFMTTEDKKSTQAPIPTAPPPYSHAPSHHHHQQRHQSTIAQARLAWGPFHVPGLLGTINNIYACTYMIFVIFWSFWPPVTPVTPSTMNYSVLVTGGVILFSIFWYYIKGRREYAGPTVDEDVLASGRLRVDGRSGSIVSVG